MERIEQRRGRRVQERLRHALDAVERGVPVAGERPADPSLAAQVRVLPLPDVLVERDGGVGHLAARSEQPRGPARQQRGRHRVQRPRAQLHAQCQARRRQPRDIRDRWGWRAPSAGHEMRGAGGVRGRLVLQPRRERVRWGRAAHLGRPGLPLPEGERRRVEGHRRSHGLRRGGHSTCRHTTSPARLPRRRRASPW